MKINNVFLARFLFIFYPCAYNLNVTIIAEEGGVELPKLFEEPKAPTSPEEARELQERREAIQKKLTEVEERKIDLNDWLQTEVRPTRHPQYPDVIKELQGLHEKEQLLQKAQQAYEEPQIKEAIRNYTQGLTNIFTEPAKTGEKVPLVTEFHRRMPEKIPREETAIEQTKHQIRDFSEKFSKTAAKFNQDMRKNISTLTIAMNGSAEDPFGKGVKEDISNQLRNTNDLYTQVTEKLKAIEQEEKKQGRTDLTELKHALTDLQGKIIDHKVSVESMLIEGLAKEKVSMWDKLKKAVKDFFKPNLREKISTFGDQLQQAWNYRDPATMVDEDLQPIQDQIDQNAKVVQEYSDLPQSELEQMNLEELQQTKNDIDQNITNLKKVIQQRANLENNFKTMLTDISQHLQRYKDEYKTLFEKIINDPDLQDRAKSNLESNTT